MSNNISPPTQPPAPSDVERVRDAIWDELCPGIRRTDADVARYGDAARAAIAALSPPSDIAMLVDDIIALEAPAEHLPEPMCQRLLDLVDRAKAIKEPRR